MAHPPLTRRIARGARALAASAYILLAIAAAAQARPADTWPQPVVHNSPAPTVVKQTLLPPASSGPDTITLLLISIAAGAALLGAGYARIATRTSRVPLTTAASAKSSTPTHSGPASRTGI